MTSWPNLMSQNSYWYQDYFYKRYHINFQGGSTQEPILASMACNRLHNGLHYFRGIFRNKDGTHKSIVPALGSEHEKWLYKDFDFQAVLRRLSGACNYCGTGNAKDWKDIRFQPIRSSELPEGLLFLETKDLRVASHFKFGVLLCKKNQHLEEDMFCNESGDEDYNRFLSLLGDKVSLCGFTKFSGGLDAKGNTTGTESVFTNHRGYDIMFHVATLLPHNPHERQQLHKKRHLGNDIVMIVYQEEGSEPYIPSCVRSNFIQVVIVVRKVEKVEGKGETYYRVNVVRQADTPPFGPPLTYPPVFKHSPDFRNWLLSKAVNAELAAYRSKLFIQQHRPTNKTYLSEVCQKYIPPGIATPVQVVRSNKSSGERTSKVAHKATKTAAFIKQKYGEYSSLFEPPNA
uniref:Rap-GAP domain-containing protein n=1 Tax=Arcella intermedia TaxID=1963864 RepID=A0A6B2L598_9EUKA